MATQKQFKVFEETVQKMVRVALPDWEVFVEFKGCSNKRWDACCELNHQSKMARITLDKDVGNDEPMEFIRKLAIHEVMHIVLADLVEIAETFGNSRIVDRAEHGVVARLCRLLGA